MCQINPMNEFRAIYDTVQKTCLPREARFLWHTLFACANERQKRNPSTGAWEWPDGFFPVSVEELKLKSAFDKRSILKARETLKEMGFIDFVPGEGNCKPALYRLFYLTRDRYKSVPAPVPDPVPDLVPDPVPDPVPDLVPDPVPDPVPIYKDIDIEKEKEKDNRKTGEDDNVFQMVDETCARVCASVARYEADKAESPTMREYRYSEIMRSFEYCFGREPKRPELERLVNYSRRNDFEPDMVLLALNQAARYDADSPVEYAISIMKEWHFFNWHQPMQIEKDWADVLKANEKYWEERDYREECGT